MGDNPGSLPQNIHDSAKQGQEFIAHVHQKMSKLVQEFATGEINRTQFHRLYDRYQRQIMTVAQLLAEADASMWREAIKDSEDTILIKKRLTAKAVGMSVYENKSGMPIETLGEFAIDPELIVPDVEQLSFRRRGNLPGRDAQYRNGKRPVALFCAGLLYHTDRALFAGAIR